MHDRANQFWIKFVQAQLKLRVWILSAMVLLTIFFGYEVFFKLKIETNFFELYPPKHEYIQLYKEFRKMFGSANVLTIALERTDGKDVYNIDTMRKLDQLTLGILQIDGVNPLQVTSATHPKVKKIVIGTWGVDVQPLTHPAAKGYPETEEECAILRNAVYTQEGIRGFYVSLDDKSAAVYAAFWEEGLDFHYLYKAINDLTASVEDGVHKCHVSGYPMLYAWMDHYKLQLMLVLLITFAAMIITLGGYFRHVRGVVIPVVSGALSGLWGLGFAGFMGFNIDPLLLVVPVLLSARALSHSCQCMDRYHQEYAVIGRKDEAIVKAYAAVFAPCLVGTLADGIGCLTICIATIPLMQKLAYVSSFWVISILLAVTILNPCILSFLPAPSIEEDKVKVRGFIGKREFSKWSVLYQNFMEMILRMSGPRAKWVSMAVIVFLASCGAYTATHLKIGDSSAGGAILYPDHPYNVAAEMMNRSFIGESRMVIVVKGREKGAIKDQKTLSTMEKLGDFMQNNIPSVGGTMSLTDIVRRINRMFHDGTPNWEMVPQESEILGQIYFIIAGRMAPGEMDMFVSMPDYTDSNVTGFFRDFNHATIKAAIAKTKEFADKVNKDPDSKVDIKVAGGILGILAAVNEEVEWSYWAIFIVIFAAIFLLCAITYRSFKAAFILILPVYISQVMCELFMMLMHIDLNIDSLPVASVGVGVGIDYGIYLMSRIKEECALTDDFEKAKMMGLTTTGKTIMFTALTLVVALIPWLFSSLKFQAEMGILMLVLMIFNMVGALVFVPSLLGVLKPKFVKEMEKRGPIPSAV
ncbi:MAG: RND family transporter [Syntrophobacteraceae bacterium]